MRNVKAGRLVGPWRVRLRGARRGAVAGAAVLRWANGLGLSGVAAARLLAASAGVVFVLAVLPETALAACPVCFDANEENRVAFLATTGLLTLLPLGMVAGFGVWLRKRARGLAEDGELE